MTASAYFNDIVIGYYEDEELVKDFGLEYGFDLDKDTFLAVSFLYPSDMRVTYEEKNGLKDVAKHIIKYSDVNTNIKGNQIIFDDLGVVVMMITRNKSRMYEILPRIKEEALKQLEKFQSEKKIRVGIGTPESGIKGIAVTYQNAVDAVKAGEIFKKQRTILEFMGMEIYSSINSMVVSYGDRLTRTILQQIDDKEKRVLGKYYKCKEDIALTAKALGISEDEVLESLQKVKIRTGLDVKDTEDNFKLHLVVIAKKVLENSEKINKSR